MKNKKILIAIMIAVIIIIIAIVITILLLNNKKEDISIQEQENNNNNINEKLATGIYRGEDQYEEVKSSINEKNDYNTFSVRGATSEKLSDEFLKEYLKEALNYPEDAYNMLDEEYRENKFGGLEEYINYINDRRDKLEEAKLSKYSISKKEGYDEILCIDQFENYYIFYKKENMDYKVVLDTYTIDIPDFLEKYESAKEQTKVGYNIEKFFNAINDKDYKYAYNVLDNIFKQNNYPTQLDFENYIKNNFYTKNELSHNEVDKQGTQYIYKITVKNAENETEQKNVTIIMQLGQKTNFVMSFSIDE